ncbi:NAD-dependent epimerase/dehydratase family protein [Caulobacter henricii]|uniref:Epimerase n=1 Tax=Caulobacter henricii TaxID=69395 RepID=A0A0P0P1S6_9CAUL|nr:NAD(P)-dependent oxidoreductase [Caulobacter henricii]ALL14185.1 epimerase [Caulobacter henricii]
MSTNTRQAKQGELSVAHGKIVVFGGSGFIGSHLLKRLVNTHAGRVVSADIRPPKEPLEGVTYIEADVRDLSNLTIEGPVETIFNFAAVHTTPGHQTYEYYETNIAGATQITAFARRTGCIDIVFTSSISVYGPSEETMTEASLPAPESAYGWSKWLAEGIHRAWLHEAENRRLLIVRPAVIFGAGEGGNFTRLASLLKKGFFVFPGRRDTIKACFYVEDLLEAVQRAHALKQRFILFNGSYPDRYTIEQIVLAFCAAHFTRARTFTLPHALLMMAAILARPMSAAGIGIHPERITKLVKSTDIIPGWLQAQGWAEPGRLPWALKRWSTDSEGRFV